MTSYDLKSYLGAAAAFWELRQRGSMPLLRIGERRGRYFRWIGLIFLEISEGFLYNGFKI